LFGGGFGQADDFAIGPAVEFENFAGDHAMILLQLLKRRRNMKDGSCLLGKFIIL
jgi:hypothetical protein